MDGEVWWWCSVAPGFFVGGGREKSLSACLTPTRCRFQVTPFLLEGRCGKPSSTILRAGGNPRTTIWSGHQRRVNGVSLLEGGAWLWALRNAWVVVGKVGGRNGCGSTLLCRFAIVVIVFPFGHVSAVAPALFVSNYCIRVVAILI
jgi:hypothetical protein